MPSTNAAEIDHCSHVVVYIRSNNMVNTEISMSSMNKYHRFHVSVDT